MTQRPIGKITRWAGFIKCIVLISALCLVFGGDDTRAAAGAASQPTIALVNAASYESAVAPGSIAALFGSAMTAQAPQAATTLPLPVSLAGVSVKVNGQTAPLFYVSATQINLQVPGNLDPGAVTIEVFNDGVTTAVASGTATVAESAPGVFTVDASGRAQAVALNADFTLNADFDRFPGSHPEVTGNFVTVYATGVGRTNPTVADGAPAPSATLAMATDTTTVTIEGVNAEVIYSGLAPGFVGLWQINAMLPASLQTNLTSALRIELRARQSAETTLAVAKRSEYGDVTGVVVSALTGQPIGGAGVTLTPSTTGKQRAATTDATGQYRIPVIAAGNYQAAAVAGGFIPASQSVAVDGGEAKSLPPIALSAPLAAGEYRAVVTWVAPDPALDLDAHLTGPDATETRFHVWWNGETNLPQPATARLDRDDLTGTGPETITFTPQNGNYRFSIHNYTDRDTGGDARLAGSAVVVRLYRSSEQVGVFSAPSGGGTLWKVFEIVNGQIVTINQLSDELEPSNIRISF